ncbi:hypothetical protein S40293_10448 [Stachybotrys chartarum IBT 40293]|nr:hypothetical protein S40293_10448 [Stachybotrys chartarum IBT 40293]
MGRVGPLHESTATSYFTGLHQGRKETQEEKHSSNQQWLPPSRFFESLLSFTSIAWRYGDQVPLCVTEALRKRPSVRLHFETFSLRGLYLRDGEEQNLDPEGYAVVTSPCLHTIVVPTSAITLSDIRTTMVK